MYYTKIILFVTLSFVFTNATQVFSQTDTLKIAILGDSRSDGEEGTNGINGGVLSKLFSLVKQQNPAAVFFTGDLTLGLEKKKNVKPGDTVNPAPTSDVFENHWEKAGFIYDQTAFRKMITTFIEIKNEHLGTEIPFYPMIGNHEAIGTVSVSLFKEYFNIPQAPGVDSMHLVYNIGIENANFVIMATDYYNRKIEALVEHNLNGGQIDWLKNELQTTKDKYNYFFVMGHEPAYSLSALSGGKAKGLDKFPKERNIFWDILKSNGVNAYVCAHEHTFDAAVQNGLWQIITGGAGAPLQPGGFYHFIILKIPQFPDGVLSIDVIDINNTLVRTIVLAKQ
ncbi:MAG TPA: metallophosphoesterase [Ignavibacteria bacterium]|nr:metallophosphoesterase [Ignavibacteria bacterium]